MTQHPLLAALIEPKPHRSGPALSEETLAARGWTRLALRLPPAESEALASLLRDGESPGLAIRRLILAASRKSTRHRK